MSTQDILTAQQLADRIDNEGLAYAILTYYGKVKCDDDKAEQLWNDAFDALTKLEDHLSKVTGGDNQT
jgi:hypothetical protein